MTEAEVSGRGRSHHPVKAPVLKRYIAWVGAEELRIERFANHNLTRKHVLVDAESLELAEQAAASYFAGDRRGKVGDVLIARASAPHRWPGMDDWGI